MNNEINNQTFTSGMTQASTSIVSSSVATGPYNVTGTIIAGAGLQLDSGITVSAAYQKLQEERDALKARVVELEAAVNRLPLTGGFHQGNGVLVCGTVRVAREDFDTDPSDQFRKEFWTSLCDVMNAALPFRTKNGTEFMAVKSEMEMRVDASTFTDTDIQKAIIMALHGTPEQKEEARLYFRKHMLLY